MKNTSGQKWISSVLAVVLIGSFGVFAPSAASQSAGNNGVYSSSGSCSPCGSSSAFVDASVFGGSSLNFCSVLNNILLHVLPSTGGGH
jgi:hypothetical protein